MLEGCWKAGLPTLDKMPFQRLRIAHRRTNWLNQSRRCKKSLRVASHQFYLAHPSLRLSKRFTQNVGRPEAFQHLYISKNLEFSVCRGATTGELNKIGGRRRGKIFCSVSFYLANSYDGERFSGVEKAFYPMLEGCWKDSYQHIKIGLISLILKEARVPS